MARLLRLGFVNLHKSRAITLRGHERNMKDTRKHMDVWEKTSTDRGNLKYKVSRRDLGHSVQRTARRPDGWGRESEGRTEGHKIFIPSVRIWNLISLTLQAKLRTLNSSLRKMGASVCLCSDVHSKVALWLPC
jgi:hypothetical protein